MSDFVHVKSLRKPSKPKLEAIPSSFHVQLIPQFNDVSTVFAIYVASKCKHIPTREILEIYNEHLLFGIAFWLRDPHHRAAN